jgi:hypothetical protein
MRNCGYQQWLIYNFTLSQRLDLNRLWLLLHCNSLSFLHISTWTTNFVHTTHRADWTITTRFRWAQLNPGAASGNLRWEPQGEGLYVRGLEGGNPYGAPNNSVHNDMLYDCNGCGSVNGTLINALELTLPTFEGLQDQNAKPHLDAIKEYLKLKNVPPSLHLAVARRSLKGISATTWGDAIWDQLRTFEDFRRIFLD